jgi:kynureninase
MAELIGAKPTEVSHSGTLTGNLHHLFTTFYRPTPKRWKIVIEKGSFPSDWYAIHSHPRVHSDILSPEQIENAVIALEPREGEDTFRTEDILQVIEDNKDEVSGRCGQWTEYRVQRLTHPDRARVDAYYPVLYRPSLRREGSVRQDTLYWRHVRPGPRARHR